jgi:hypothetical protein
MVEMQGAIFLRNDFPRKEQNEMFLHDGKLLDAAEWTPDMGAVSIYVRLKDYIDLVTG